MPQDYYDSSSISVLKGLEAVRRRPGMYTDTVCPNHLGQEVIDNSIDEALAGHCDHISIVFGEDHSLEVSDNGRGMPVDIHPEEGIPGVEVILETLHAGGKFGGGSYDHSGGLHGVGISVVNALSLELNVQVKRDGLLQAVDYENGDKVKSLYHVKKIAKKVTGTTVLFRPDPKYFDNKEFNREKLIELVRYKTMLCPCLKVSIYDEFTNQEHNFHFPDGIKSEVEGREDAQEAVGSTIFFDNGEKGDMLVSWACYWNVDKSGLRNSFVNLIPTVRHGTHVNGLKDGLFKAVREFADFHNIEPPKVKITSDDLWRNVNFILSFKMLEPQFSGQTKECLSSRTAAQTVSSIVQDRFSLFLNHDVEKAKVLCELFVQNAAARTRAANKVERKKIGKVMALPGKLTDCSTNIREDAEIFVVEGDSAGGSAKQARDRVNQAILPLRGKILNTWEVASDVVLKSKEISDISTAIGVSPDSDDLSEQRYGKICILADADSDGAHIASLAVCLFVRHFRAVINQGHVYIAMPPLYRIDVGKQVFYALDESEKDATLRDIEAKKIRGTVSVQRFKGLGEMNPKQLKETALDPMSRRLVQLTTDDTEELDEVMSMLMAKKRSGDRLTFITENSDMEYTR